MIAALVLVPLLAAVLALILRPDGPRRALLILTAAAHLGLSLATWASPPPPMFEGWLEIDAFGRLFLTITSVLFLVVSIYAVGYLSREKRQCAVTDFLEGRLFVNAPEAIFTACLLFFLATMTLVNVSHHLGVMWVAIEATTLASAPLLYFHRHHRSLEATWKYLLLCSVGIGLALLGNFFLAVSAIEGGHVPMVLGSLIEKGPHLAVPWLRIAFVLALVGYGTKMGLAPMHSWKPDVYSEAPSLVAALLSGALANCAFLGILRFQQVNVAAGQGAFGQELLVVFGLLSMVVAAAFVVGQPDYKRMLAYSSVEHMGILALGVGLGGAGPFGAMLHAVNHSFTKGMLFLVAGNIMARYRTKTAVDVTGVTRAMPASGVLWVAGFLAITGSPPFGPFLSEFTLLKAALDQDRLLVAGLYLALLAIIFVGMATVVLRMAQGSPGSVASRFQSREPVPLVLPPALLGALVLLLGLYIPPPLEAVLRDAARLLGGP